MKDGDRKALRCAIYTRVSTEHGLEQEFNSLHNQREAAEAYVKSQAHEGWRCSRERYDDGGFSGGSMERPALQRLLEAIRSRLIDVVVVYKVDRLTRSLTDFAKLVELFDQHAVSFVSVTQAFNTTTSMGRLTLNVLLSFAQFEREVTGERIRDKIAASKKKGFWMGGVVPLGYRVESRKLIVDETEAALVHMIFERYVALGSLPALQEELRHRGILTRSRQLASGKRVGGVPFTIGPLAYMLRNRVYLGEINHKGRSHPGEHAPIIAPELFEAVQQKLGANLNGHRLKRASSQALLMGRIFDDRGNRMTPSHAKKKGARYRYYVSCVLAQGRKAEAGSQSRVPAHEIEAAVMQALRFAEEQDADEPAAATTDAALVERYLDRVVVSPSQLQVQVSDGAQPILLPWTPPNTSRRRELILPHGSDRASVRPLKVEERAKILRAIARARAWLDDLVSTRVPSTDEIATRESVSERSVRMTLKLAFLSPEIVKATIDGRLPRGIGLSRLTDLPSAWDEQQSALGVTST